MTNRLYTLIGLVALGMAIVACTASVEEAPRAAAVENNTGTGRTSAGAEAKGSDSTDSEGQTAGDGSGSTNASSGSGDTSSPGAAAASPAPKATPASGSSGNYSDGSADSSTTGAAANSTTTPSTTTPSTTTPSDPVVSGGNFDGGSDSGASTDGSGAADGAQPTSAAALKARIAARQADLQRERDRNGRLRSELTMTRNGGCWSEQRIKKLEIEINGSHLPNGQAKRGSSAKQNQGNAGQMKIVFSEMMSVTIENEEQQQLFSPMGRHITQDFAANLIRDITMIKVVKGGVAYISSRVSKPGFMGIGGWSGFDSFETNRYSLGGMTIKINDQIFYKKTNIGYTFEGDKRSWQEGAFGTNSDYMRLMSRQDCPANQ